mmetsp:Transcript_50792/g.145098  ORF Transcript_50792/g.145098 Transcript_50792/m.145098 type:complete len:242 (-) Transcript_50792:104-829(-)
MGCQACCQGDQRPQASDCTISVTPPRCPHPCYAPQQRWNVEVVAKKVAFHQRQHMAGPPLGWLRGYKRLLVLEVTPGGVGSQAKQTYSGAQEDFDPDGYEEVWVWDLHPKEFEEPAEGLIFTVEASTDLQLRIFGSYAAGGGNDLRQADPPKLLAEARFTIDEEIESDLGSPQAISLPLVLESRVCGKATMLVSATLAEDQNSKLPSFGKPSENEGAAFESDWGSMEETLRKYLKVGEKRN